MAILLFMIVRHRNAIVYPAKFSCWLGLKVGGTKVRVTGMEHLDPKQTYVFMANHQSAVDAPLLFVVLKHPLAFLAKKELYRLPIFNPGLRWIDSVPVDRSNRQKAIESTRLATEKLKRGRSFLVYAEGTRSPDGQIKTFKKGGFHMAMEARVPIVPISIDGAHAVMPKREIRVTPGTVRVTIHPPVDTREYKVAEMDQLMQRVWDTVASGLSATSVGP
jgi:1-acyl-sn-glycerol-3-phosphate acyltransferase